MNFFILGGFFRGGFTSSEFKAKEEKRRRGCMIRYFSHRKIPVAIASRNSSCLFNKLWKCLQILIMNENLTCA